MRVSDPVGLGQLLAQRSVQRGIRWLNQNAPVGWHRNLFEPRPNGCSYYRARMRSNDESVLALSFEQYREFTDESGHVTDFNVSRHFDLFGRKKYLLGFTGKTWHDKVVTYLGTLVRANSVVLTYAVVVTSHMLDKAWEDGIYARDFSSLPHRHLTVAEILRFNELGSPNLRRLSFWQRFRNLWPDRSATVRF